MSMIILDLLSQVTDENIELVRTMIRHIQIIVETSLSHAVIERMSQDEKYHIFNETMNESEIE